MFEPAFEYRAVLSRDFGPWTFAANDQATPQRWHVANHVNGGGDRTGNFIPTVIPEAMGGMMMYSNDTCTSSVYALVPPLTSVQHHTNHCQGDCTIDGHYHNHPEWYSLLSSTASRNTTCAKPTAHTPAGCMRAWNASLAGVPGQGPWNMELCMSNQEMRAALINRSIEKLRWDKENFGGVQFIGVSDNDQAGPIGACECEKCAAARRADGGTGVIGMGGQSGLSLQVANDLAIAIGGEFPDVRVVVESYQDKIFPPTSTRPHPSVLVNFCPLSQVRFSCVLGAVHHLVLCKNERCLRSSWRC